MRFLVRVAAAAVTSLLAIGSAHALTVYSSVDEENAKKLLDAFSKATGVETQMVFLSSGPALSRIEAEKANPQADVWFGAPSENHILAKERGLTEPYVSQNAAALSDEFKDKEGYWHAIYTNPLAIGVRTDILESRKAPVPTSWEDLKNPAYKGLIQMPSPQSSGTAYALILTLIDERGEDGAFDYLKAINPNVQTYTQSGTAPSGALGVGETPLAIQFTPGFLKLADEGYPVQVVFPSEGVGYEVAAMSILKGAKNVDDAKKLVDWMTSADGQGALSATKTYFLPIRSDVSGGTGVPALDKIKLVSSDPKFAAENKKRLVERWTKDVLGQ
ncbi:MULTISPECIES: ABC transporter substrate-binding protein [Phyllobacteriaceae]|uniref:ABC transporter substrate-binding protein n=1 Tax=Ollibium composti TaxID=2675109 RepID=A0ABY2Q730_9HYPH|nr:MULTISPECIES: ABC transporter substrate-binding protein [Mesorhizobium]QDC01597.1 ABC transporter substrate-binding protein [Mesorhizobium sp. 8]THF56992.1 ABC transporter substrate-binding protein [Mesorhizobium composti]